MRQRIGWGGPWLVHARPETPAQTYVPPAVIEPVHWTNTYQGGALSLPVNVALLAIAVVGATLWANRPTPPPSPEITSPYIYPNLAVNLQTQRPAGRYIEPTQYPRWSNVATAPDVYPNIAVKFSTQQNQPAGHYIEPVK